MYKEMNESKKNKPPSSASTSTELTSSSEKVRFAIKDDGSSSTNISELTDAEEKQLSTPCPSPPIEECFSTPCAFRPPESDSDDHSSERQVLESNKLTSLLSLRAGKASTGRLVSDCIQTTPFSTLKHYPSDISLKQKDSMNFDSSNPQTGYEKRQKEVLDWSSEPFIIIETMNEPEDEEEEYVIV
jgi:hypothetical protein